MRDNILLKILCSIPVILVTLYFIPFLGVCLLIFRYIVYYYDKRRISTPYYLVSIGLIILIPKLVQYIFKTFNLKTSIIPYFDTIINSNLYNIDFIKYSKLLIILGIIFLIITSIVSSFVDKTKSYVKSYIANQEKRNDEISRKNDLIMKEKREIAKNTSVVICPYCGADNMLTEKTGTCKYCRRKIESK